MASYHMSIKNGKKGAAAKHAQYISRMGKHGSKGKVEELKASFAGNLPEWAKGDSQAFWKAADKFERANGAAYREYELALPAELTLEQNLELVKEFIEKQIGAKTFQCAIHCPEAALGRVPQPHVHAMFSDRLPDNTERTQDRHFRRYNPNAPDTGGCKKDSGGRSRLEMRAQATQLRETWAQLQNAALERHGYAERVDHRSNKARDIAEEPERHLGQAAVRRMTGEEKVQFESMRSHSNIA